MPIKTVFKLNQLPPEIAVEPPGDPEVCKKPIHQILINPTWIFVLVSYLNFLLFEHHLAHLPGLMLSKTSPSFLDYRPQLRWLWPCRFCRCLPGHKE